MIASGYRPYRVFFFTGDDGESRIVTVYGRSPMEAFETLKSLYPDADITHVD